MCTELPFIMILWLNKNAIGIKLNVVLLPNDGFVMLVVIVFIVCTKSRHNSYHVVSFLLESFISLFHGIDATNPMTLEIRIPT